MQKAYIRPDPRFSARRQKALVLTTGVSDRQLYIEGERTKGAPFPERDALVKSLRPGARDEVVVSHFHRLAVTADGLREVIKEIQARGATILEAESRRSTADHVNLTAMIFDAVEHYRVGGRAMKHEEAVRRGKLGGATRKKGRMPHSLARAIWQNPIYESDIEALAEINSRKYATKYNRSYAYRNLGKRGTISGPRPEGYKRQVALRRQSESGTAT